jgi:ribulose-bisphosphate carboxylase large chain
MAKDCGVRMALVAPMLVGVPAFIELQVDLDLPILAHPAFAGATRIAPRSPRQALSLFGADATIFPNYGGRFSYSRETCLAIARGASALAESHAALPCPPAA